MSQKSAAARQWLRPRTLLIVFLYLCASVQFVRFYLTDSSGYLDLHAYFAGTERLPFQERVLPIALLRPLFHFFATSRFAANHQKALGADRAPLFLVSLAALLVAGVCTQMLYERVSSTRALSFLVYPLLLLGIVWSYSLHVEANFFYPYDLLAVAFFSAGLLCIYTRRFLPLLLVIVLGTLNRETTLFLIGIYVLDATSTAGAEAGSSLRERFSFRQVPWMRAAFLFVLWLAIKLAIAHRFAGNSRVDDIVRYRENVPRLLPQFWPVLLDICGYLLPLVLLLRTDLQAMRFRNYLWIVPPWVAVMFYNGVITETRIFGELCPYAAVAVLLIAEQRVRRAAMPLDKLAADDVVWPKRRQSAGKAQTAKGSRSCPFPWCVSFVGLLRSTVPKLTLPKLKLREAERRKPASPWVP